MPVVLVVEDEEQVRVLAESILQEEGFETLSANGAEGARALLANEERTVDLLFTDIGLFDQRHGGVEFAQEAVGLRPRLRVLYTTGQGVTDGMRAFVESSAFLAKPYTPDALRAVSDLLGARF
jgi:DNA-binding NtrC family response regulator